MTTSDRCEASGTRRADWPACPCAFCLAVAVRNVNRAHREMAALGLHGEPPESPGPTDIAGTQKVRHGMPAQGWGWDQPVFTVEANRSRILPDGVRIAEAPHGNDAPRTVLHGEREISFDE